MSYRQTVKQFFDLTAKNKALLRKIEGRNKYIASYDNLYRKRHDHNRSTEEIKVIRAELDANKKELESYKDKYALLRASILKEDK